MTKELETWIIVDKETGQQWKSESGKSSWRGKGHAKNAYNYSRYGDRTSGKSAWDCQDQYEVKEISLSRIYALEARVKELEWILEGLEK